ncbi:MAG: transporter substrate-binding domain-containing protein [Bacteroidia bacterium]|nr:transporter substrate-binding domain-containing protein [Bacteroidia bacterium]
MKSYRTKIFDITFFILLNLLSGILITCTNNSKIYKDNPQHNQLQEIRKRGYLIAVTDYNSTDYFCYKGYPVGFQYEMLVQYAKHLGVGIKIIVNKNHEKRIALLLDNECDILAVGSAVIRSDTRLLNYVHPYIQTHQVLVQRKPEGWHGMTKSKIEAQLIRNPIELTGKQVYIPKGSAFQKRLQNIIEEIGDTIYIKDTSDLNTEQLISMVAKGDIDYTISDENIARVNQIYYPEIDIETDLSFYQNHAWAVRIGADSLLNDLNTWFLKFLKTKKFTIIYNKYYKNPKSVYIIRSEYCSLNKGKISPYDELIKKYSKIIDWDWRLLASVVCQESGFQHDIESCKGAYGLMQIMPETAEQFEIDSISTAEESIFAGAKFLKSLDNSLKNRIPDSVERIKFVLASYNVGLGHVLDARKLAEKYQKDTSIWNGNVDSFLLKKSEPEFYLDSIVKFGYCRGDEPFRFVQEVLERYSHYVITIPE